MYCFTVFPFFLKYLTNEEYVLNFFLSPFKILIFPPEFSCVYLKCINSQSRPVLAISNGFTVLPSYYLFDVKRGTRTYNV